MKKQLLTLIALTIITAAGCKKDSKETEKPKSLVGAKFESYWFTASGGEKFYKRLVFKSDTKVDYFITYTNDTFLTGNGKSELTYSIDDPTKVLPKITITGILNDISGKPDPKESVNWVLTYTPELGTTKASLDMKGVYYMKY
jgi:hypothetical protein